MESTPRAARLVVPPHAGARPGGGWLERGGARGNLPFEELVRQCQACAQPRLELEVEARDRGGGRAAAHAAEGALAPLAPRAAAHVPAAGGLRAGVRRAAGRAAGPDFRLAQHFAERAALALDNARLYQEAREAIALREQFVVVAGHELRTPLTALLLGLESLQRRLTGRASRGSCSGGSPSAGARAPSSTGSSTAAGRRPASPRDALRLDAEELELTSLVEDTLQKMMPQFEKAGCAISLTRGSQPGGVVGPAAGWIKW